MKQDLKSDKGWVVFGVVLGAAAYALSGCSGIGISHNLSVHRVDEAQHSQRTYREAIPWKCYFVPCSDAAGEAQGS